MSLLTIKDLRTSFFTPAGRVQAVNGVTYSINRGEVLGIVGESGSGKSVSAYSVMGLLGATGKVTEGSICLEGRELRALSEKELSRLRGDRISIVFQDPMTSLNPVLTVGEQLMEAILLHTHRNRSQARERAVEMLSLVGVNEPSRRIKQYPHEFSGGMRQRVMIAMALACEPDILIADEPTTALDVTVQAQILELMKDLQKKLNMAIILITHDLGVVAQMCDRVIVMYAGQVCESGTVEEIFRNPQHQYTVGLLRSVPAAEDKKTKLRPIGGSAVDLLNLPEGCPFAPRCEAAMKVCLGINPRLISLGEGHCVRCFRQVRESLEAGRITPEELEAMYKGDEELTAYDR